MKKNFRIGSPLMLAVALVVFTIAQAVPRGTAAAASVTYYSAPGGTDTACTLASPCTLNTGLGKLAAGDTLYLRGGTYAQTMSVNTSGTAAAPILIAPYASERVVLNASGIDSGGFNVCHNALTFSGSYVSFTGIEVMYPLGCGIWINRGATHDVLSHLYVHEVFGYGIYNMGDNNTIENSVVTRVNLSNSCAAHNGCGYSFWSGGISWGDTTVAQTGLNTVVRNNIVHDTYGEGIMGMYTSGAVVENNVTYDNWALGIYAANSSNFTIRNNLVYYTTNHDFWRFGNSAPAGIMIADENQISGQPNGHDRQVYNNIIVNAGYGIYFWTGAQSGAGLKNDVIANNTIVDNLAGAGIRIETGSHVNTFIENNIVQVGASATPLALSASGLTFTHNLWSRTPSLSGAGDVIGNPLLVSSGNSVDGGIDVNWYKLTALSPAIDRALVLSQVVTDYFGATRGSLPDIGGAEYTGGTVPTPTITSTATSVGPSPTPTASATSGGPSPTPTASATSGGPSPTPTAPATSTPAATATPGSTGSSATYVSVGIADGQILESAAGSGVGGNVNAIGATARLGDDASNRQYRVILTFDTSALPDTATIKSVTLKTRNVATTGSTSNPFTSMGNIAVDIAKGSFGGDVALAAGDFRAAASKNSALSITNSLSNSWYSAAMPSVNYGYINRAGITQLRLRFTTASSHNGAADYIAVASGDNTSTSYRPELVITYSVP